MSDNPDIQNDPNQCGYSLPVNVCVGDDGPTPEQVAVISKSGGSKPGAGGYPGAYGDPYAGGKSAGRAGAQGGAIPTVVSGPDLPNDHDTDDPNRS